jgi:hypothetical protein
MPTENTEGHGTGEDKKKEGRIQQAQCRNQNVESAALRLQSSPDHHSAFVILSAFGFRHSFAIRISSLIRHSDFVID